MADWHGMSMCTDAPSDQPPDARHGDATPPAAPAAADARWLGLRITHDGTWLYRGSPIRRKELVKLFASVLRREADGSYWLVTPVERGRIEVDDVPFVAVELAVAGTGSAQQRLRLRTNLDEWLTLECATGCGFAGRGAKRPVPGRCRTSRSAPASRPVSPGRSTTSWSSLASSGHRAAGSDLGYGVTAVSSRSTSRDRCVVAWVPC